MELVVSVLGVDYSVEYMDYNPSNLVFMVGRFRVKVAHTPCEGSVYMHRYVVECTDMDSLVRIYSESNVIGREHFYGADKALGMVIGYFNYRFGMNPFLSAKKAT
jgi:hypothetical protein